MGSLMVCGRCGDDQNDKHGDEMTLKKVVYGDYADILCAKCRGEVEAGIGATVRKELRR
ncbi:hypothetical protein LCGC14_0757390 [marine sediment metagenome]|uniref:Uncharacterized protein n=1 Tax=marine sediment metagenome TaxID=412755 RepID=A0A0F9QM02_9ZZZZ